jgi:hypothetical protein
MTTPEQREIRQLKARLKKLSAAVVVCLEAFDREMKKPPSPERGSRIARICNALELENDGVLHFALSMSFPQIKAFKKKTIKGSEAK